MGYDGLLVVDKPSGWTSHDVVARVRRLTGERRVGHAGTLDPLATGVLVLGVGQGTRVLRYLEGAGKTYRARVRLGQSTNTYDAEGEITAESSAAGVNYDQIEAALTQFRGTFEQRPPLFSALKRDGRPLYLYARAGVEVEVATRTVSVEALTLLAFDPPDLDLELSCSSGFYVRSLAHDLGESLGCGGHLLALRRTRVGPFSDAAAWTIEKLEQHASAGTLRDLLGPLDTPLLDLPAVLLSEEEERAIIQGKGLKLLGVPAAPESTLCRAYAVDGSLVAVLALDEFGDARPQRVFPPGHRGRARERILGPILRQP
jgi:tRNA pseudouridine55 synthase